MCAIVDARQQERGPVVADQERGKAVGEADHQALNRRVAELDQSLDQAPAAAEERIGVAKELAELRSRMAELHHRLARSQAESAALREALGRADSRVLGLQRSEEHLSEELQASYEDVQVLADQLEKANADLEARIEQRTRQLVETEARYRTLFEAMDEGFYLTEVIFDAGRPLDILYLEENPAATRMVGQSLVGRRLREVGTGFEAHWYEMFGRVALTGEPARTEMYAAPLQAWFNLFAFRVGGAESRRVAVVFEDVTERKKAARALEESERLLREALSVGEMAAWTWDPETDEVTESETAAGVFGLLPGETFQSSAKGFRLVHPEDAARVHAIADEAQARGQSWHAEFRIIRPRDGRIAWLEERATTALDPLTGRMRRIGLVWDITERKTAEAELKRAKEEAEAANHAKTKFLAAASHDLRQPIQAAALYAYVLRASIGADPDAVETLELLRASIESLNGMLSGLLDLSRLEAGAVKVEIVDFVPTDLMQRLASEFGGVARLGGVTLRCCLSSLPVRTDPQLLERTLRNLVSNAITHGAVGGRGKVLLGVRRRRDAVEFQVWDNGPGIPESDRDAIFEEFRQLKNPERNAARGFGLGLSIVARIAKLLGVEVTVRSHVGKGSVFSVTVPRARAPEPVRLTAPVFDAGMAAWLKGRTVLLVEDDEHVRRGLSLMLRRWGVKVIALSSTEELADRLPRLRSRPHVVLTDYRLPGGATGRTVVELVRRRWDVPGVIITGDTAPVRLREASSLGCRLLHKPVEPTALVQALGEALHA